MAKALSCALGAPLVFSTISRLVVDLNRSIHHPQLFSPETAGVPVALREAIVERYYRPYREAVENLVQRALARNRRVIHISSHTFVPVLSDVERRADVGLLYDPTREGETALCARWKALLGTSAPELRVRRNYPYRGNGDGLTNYLRKRFSPDAYVGVELEVNQKIVLAGRRRWTAVRSMLIDTLLAAKAASASR